jgi:inner membrane protein
MDPVTHAVVGGLIAQALLGRQWPRSAWVLGVLAGMSPDMDIFFTGQSLIASLFHRGPTHSIALLPLMAGLCLLPWLLRAATRTHLWRAYGVAMLGVASHLFIDACTSFGTMVYWPFSPARVALDWVPIVDPILTLSLLALLWAALWRKQLRWAAVGLAVCAMYFSLGAIQHERVMATQTALSATRGEVREHGRVMPTFGNMWVWRSLYRTQDNLVADAIRATWSAPQVAEGTRVPRPVANTYPTTPTGALFLNFTDGFVLPYGSPVGAQIWADARYSLDTRGFVPLWGMRIHADDQAQRISLARRSGHSLWETWNMQFGHTRAYRPLTECLSGQPGPAGLPSGHHNNPSPRNSHNDTGAAHSG